MARGRKAELRAADMRADEDAGSVPQRVARRQRFRVGDVEGGRAAARDSSSASSAVVSTTGPRATFTSSAPSFIRARKSASTRPRVCVGERGGEHHDVRLGQEGGQVGERMHRAARGAARAERATRATRAHSNGASRSSIAAPIEP